MPAYFDSGFCVREPSWHRGELLLDDYPVDWNDARVKAGLMWEPALEDLFQLRTFTPPMPKDEADLLDFTTAYQIKADDDGNVSEVLLPITGKKLVVRDDTHAQIGVVSDQFSLVSHGQMGEIMEAILGLTNVKFETAGSVNGGAQVWALAYIDEPDKIANDDTASYPYIVLLNAHDGSGACKLIATTVRVVCWNTYQMASMEGERTGRQFIFRHVGDVTARIEEAKKALAGVRDEFAEWDAMANELYGMKCGEVEFNHFLQDFLPDPVAELGAVVSPRVQANVEKAHRIFTHIYNDSPTTEGHRGTALGLVDTAVEYLDHVRGYRSSDSYLGRTLLRPEPLKAKAVLLAREHCN